MKIKLPSAFPFFTVSLSLLFLVACGPVVPIPTETATSTSSPIPITDTPPAEMTFVPAAGDLGWGTVHGKIVDANTGLPVEGATVKCEHSSYTSSSLCKGITATNSEGLYVFLEVFFHDTDRITLTVEAPGYTPLRFEQSFFTQPDFRADLKLFPSTDDTPTPTPIGPTPTMSDLTPPTPFLMCTAPACPGGRLVCGKAEGCLGGCGTICLTATPSP